MSDDDKIIKSNGEEYHVLSASAIEYVLAVNRKAVEIQIEVEGQNEQILSKLDKLIDEVQEMKTAMVEAKFATETNIKLLSEIKPKVEDTKDNLFKLIVFLGIIGAGTVFQVLQALFHK